MYLGAPYTANPGDVIDEVAWAGNPGPSGVFRVALYRILSGDGSGGRHSLVASWDINVVGGSGKKWHTLTVNQPLTDQHTYQVAAFPGGSDYGFYYNQPITGDGLELLGGDVQVPQASYPSDSTADRVPFVYLKGESGPPPDPSVISSVDDCHDGGTINVTVDKYDAGQTNVRLDGVNVATVEVDATTLSFQLDTLTVDRAYLSDIGITVYSTINSESNVVTKQFLPPVGYSFFTWLVESGGIPPQSIWFDGTLDPFPGLVVGDQQAYDNLGGQLVLNGVGAIDPASALAPGAYSVDTFNRDVLNNFAAGAEGTRNFTLSGGITGVNKFTTDGDSTIEFPTLGNILVMPYLAIVIPNFSWTTSNGYAISQAGGGVREFGLYSFSGDIRLKLGDADTTLGAVADFPATWSASVAKFEFWPTVGRVRVTLDDRVILNRADCNIGVDRVDGEPFRVGGRDGGTYVPAGTEYGDVFVYTNEDHTLGADRHYVMPASGTSVPDNEGGGAGTVVNGSGTDFSAATDGFFGPNLLDPVYAIGADGFSRVPFRAKYVGIALGTGIEFRVMQGGSPVAGLDWTAADETNGYQATWTPKIPVGTGYTIETRLDGGGTYSDTSAAFDVDLVVGLIGSSSAERVLTRNTGTVTNTIHRRSISLTAWQTDTGAVIAGEQAATLANYIATNAPYGDRLGMINGGDGGTRARNSWTGAGGDAMKAAMNLFQGESNISVMVQAVGFNDAGNDDITDQAEIIATFEQIRDNLLFFMEYPDMPIVVMGAQRDSRNPAGLDTPMTVAVRDEQQKWLWEGERQLAENNANVYLVSRISSEMSGDNLHISDAAANNVMSRVGNAIDYVFDDAAYYRGPKIIDATLAGSVVTINVGGAGTAFTTLAPASGIEGFTFYDTGAEVATSSITTSGTEITATLTVPPVGPITFNYAGDKFNWWGDGSEGSGNVATNAVLADDALSSPLYQTMVPITASAAPVVNPPEGFTYDDSQPSLVGDSTPWNASFTGGDPATSFAVIAGALPAGRTLNTSTGQITGTFTLPETSGSATVEASNAGGSTTTVINWQVQEAGVDPFSFNSITDAELSTVTESNIETITGVAGPWNISIVDGDYRINGGAYVSAPGTIDDGDTVQLRVTSSAAYSTTSTASLTIDGVTQNFNVTTKSDPNTGGGGSGGGFESMAISSAIDASAVAQVVGIKTQFKDLRGGRVVLLPQVIGVVGQGASSAVYSTDKRQVLSAVDAGERYGFGSPIHLAVKQLMPTNGDGVGTIPVIVHPLEDDGSGVASSGDITPVVAQTEAAAYLIRVNNVDSEKFVISVGDTVAAVTAKITDAINAVLDMPIIATDNATDVSFVSKWAGASANDIYVEVVGSETAGTTFAVTQATGGLVNPDVQPALDQIGDTWETLIVNCLELADTTALSAYTTFGEGRWGSLVHKPLMVLTGNVEADPTNATAIADGRKTDKVNSCVNLPGSKELPLSVAARAVSRVAVVANNNPATDYGSQALTGLIPGSDADQWDYPTRDFAVKRGGSTTIVRDGVPVLQDVITFYHPSGDPLPAYRRVVGIIRNMNVIFNTALIFEKPEWAGAPLIPSDQATTNRNAKKPSMAVAEVAAMIDNLGLEAIISDPKGAKATIIAGINSSNPDRLDIAFTVPNSGNTNQIAIDYNFGFFFGTNPVIA